MVLFNCTRIDWSVRRTGILLITGVTMLLESSCPLGLEHWAFLVAAAVGVCVCVCTVDV